MNIALHEILQKMSTDELQALNDYDGIAEDFLSQNFSYRDTTATDSLVAGIKDQNLTLARFETVVVVLLFSGKQLDRVYIDIMYLRIMTSLWRGCKQLASLCSTHLSICSHL
jgi:hypothetical protein